jgi:hypothetical protein
VKRVIMFERVYSLQAPARRPPISGTWLAFHTTPRAEESVFVAPASQTRRASIVLPCPCHYGKRRRPDSHSLSTILASSWFNDAGP